MDIIIKVLYGSQFCPMNALNYAYSTVIQVLTNTIYTLIYALLIGMTSSLQVISVPTSQVISSVMKLKPCSLVAFVARNGIGCELLLLHLFSIPFLVFSWMLISVSR